MILPWNQKKALVETVGNKAMYGKEDVTVNDMVRQRKN